MSANPKPILVLALGNPLAGNDDVGAHICAAVAGDAAINEVAEFVAAGTDLYRHAERMRGRRRLVLIDAALSTGTAARVMVVRHPPGALAARRSHAHDLDPVGTLEVLRRMEQEVATVDTWWLLVNVPEVTLGVGLTPAVQQLVAEGADYLRMLLLERPLTP